MSDFTTIARPYAQAVFELAKAQGNLPAWSDMLKMCAQVVRDPNMHALLGSPRVDRAQLAQLIIDVCGQGLSADGANMVRLLADNRRLQVLPEIAQSYENLRAEAEGMVEAEIHSPFPVSEAQLSSIAAALKVRLGREVALKSVTDASLLGGAIIRAGDLVIDGSVRGRLEKLATALIH